MIPFLVAIRPVVSASLELYHGEVVKHRLTIVCVEKIKLFAQRSSSTEPCRPLIDRENAVSEVPYPPRYGDVNWLLKVLLDQWHPKEGEMDGGTTDIRGAEPTSSWIPLLE